MSLVGEKRNIILIYVLNDYIVEPKFNGTINSRIYSWNSWKNEIVVVIVSKPPPKKKKTEATVTENE